LNSAGGNNGKIPKLGLFLAAKTAELGIYGTIEEVLLRLVA
jgi:hypothetical protein